MENSIQRFITVVKNKIVFLANTELNNEEKKERLDDMAQDYAENLINNLPVNFIVKWALKKAIIENIPTITQGIYDLLKEKIKGL